MKNSFAGQTKRYLAVLLSVTVLFTMTACNGKKDPAQSDESVTETTSATTTVPTETTTVATTEPTEETTTETTEPEPATVTGVYMMMYDRFPGEAMPIGARLELYLEDDQLTVMFEQEYGNQSTPGYSVQVSSNPFGPFVADYKEEGNVITAAYEGEWRAFELSADGKTADVSFSIMGESDADRPGCYTGHYVRQDYEEYSQDSAPVSGNDPATPGGKVDVVLAKVARKQLGKPEGSVLTEEDLSKIYDLDIYSEYGTSLNGIEYFTNLSRLNIQVSYIQDISPLAKLKSLREVYISGALVDTIPDLSSCTSLSTLNILGCCIRDITPVTRMGSLKTLGLSSNRITSVAPIKDMTSLESLGIADNPITDWETIEGNDKLISAIGQDYYEGCRKVLDKARAIVNETITADMSDLEKEIAMYEKIHEISEMEPRERTSDDLPYGYTVIMEGWGICMDYQEAVSLLMTLAGLECFGCNSATHEWNFIKIDGVYYEIDCMWDDRNPIREWNYFNLSRGRMDNRESHHTEFVDYPTADCSMLHLKYLRMRGIVDTD